VFQLEKDMMYNIGLVAAYQTIAKGNFYNHTNITRARSYVTWESSMIS